MHDEKQSRFVTLPLVGLLVLLVVALTVVIIVKNKDPPEFPIPQPLYGPSRTKSSNDDKTTPPTRPSEPPEKTTKPRNVCETPECITLAQQLHNFRDKSVDPCENFYKSVCGKYSEHSVIDGPNFSRINRIFNKLTKEYLIASPKTTSKSENDMKILYDKCEENNRKNPEIAEKERWKEIFDLIHKIQPWPLVEPNFQESDFDLNDVLSKTAGYGFKTLGLLQMMSVVIPVLPIAPMPGLFWSNEKRDLFKQTVIRALKRNDVIVDQSIFEEDWKSFVDFEEELYGFRGSIIEEMVGVEDLKKAVPSMDIERIIKSFMRPKERDEMWERIKDSILIQKHPMLFGETKNLETILATTPKRTIANYLAFHLVGIMSGKEPTDCIKVVTERLPLAALRVYVRNYFDKGNLKDVSDMVNDIKKSYIKLFEESKWLHDETRINAIRKVGAMTHMIGYPEELEEPGSLDKFFESLDLSPSDSYFTAIQKTEKFYMELSIDFVAQLIRIWSYSIVLDANAFYLTMSNLLFVNVALIDDPFFDSTYPKYAKLAGVGAVLGHEMGHGFDPENRKRDENGAMKNWWTPEDSKEYQKRAKCYADEYTNYDDPQYGKNLNGSFAITEIIPDVIGVKSAWKTYKSMDMSGEPGIIGFEDYDLDKLYFQIGALTWCSSRKSKTLAEQQQDNHATPSFRVNGVFSNMKEFGETFNCPVGSPMNPIKKCELF